MAGWICLWRDIKKWEWYTDIPTKVLFIHMLIEANHKTKTWRGIEIKEGSFVSGRLKLSEETGLSQQQIRTSMDKLKSTQEITSKATNKFTIYTIENYSKYQDKEETATNNPTNQQPTNNQQITTTNNVNNVNKETKRTKDLKDLPAKADDPMTKIFEFWKSTMGKTSAAKLNAKRQKAIKARMAEGYTTDQIMQAIEGCSKTPHNMGQNDNGKRYDELELICRDGSNVERFAGNAAPLEHLDYSKITAQNIEKLQGNW